MARARTPGVGTRPAAVGTEMMVASGHPLATIEGLAALKRGGNAIDAAVTMAAMSTVVLPNMCGLGGDCFALVYRAATGRVDALNASGRAPTGATAERFATGIPLRGALAATVPGCLSGWAQLLARHGTVPLAEALAPAIHLAERGAPFLPRAHAMLTGVVDVMAADPYLARTFLEDETLRPPLSLIRQPGLAATLRQIARDGADIFYRGPFADRIAAATRERGGLITREDLAAHRPEWTDPIRTTYRGYEVLEIPPNSWGILLPMQLNILAGYDLARPGIGSAAYWHLLIEAAKLAFADGAAYIADPAIVPVSIAGLLSPEYAAERRRLIDPAKAAPSARPGTPPGGDTTYMCAVDRDGNAVSLIQSLFHHFGCGVTVGDTGITLNNRMNGFSVEPSHPNCVAPGKRPAHTLSPAMVLRDRRPEIIIGTPGAAMQTQALTQVLTRMIDGGMDIAEAIDAPRVRSEEGAAVHVETGIPARVTAALTARGHQVTMEPAGAALMGSVKAIRIDRVRGLLLGAADARRTGLALGE